MIVKNEEHIIERCLKSVLPFIHRYSIVDTGSSDKTVEVIQSTLSSLPGKVHSRPWVNFAANRTESLRLAESERGYVLVIDADDRLINPDGFKLPQLVHDAYYLEVIDGDLRYDRLHLLRCGLPWKYESVLHEYVACDSNYTSLKLDAIKYHRLGGGARSKDPTKYLKDADILEAALLKEPDNSRYRFYLAQSYRDANVLNKAVTNYEIRSRMSGWDEETYVSLYQMACLLERISEEQEQVVTAYLNAYENRPTRAESLVSLSAYYRKLGKWNLAHLFAQRALKIPYPQDRLFVEDSVYAWRALDEFAVSAYWVGKYRESRYSCQTLLRSNRLPVSEIERVTQNLKLASDKLSLA